MSQVEAENLTSWLKDVYAVINEGGRLAPAKASQKMIGQLLNEVDGDGLLQVAETLGVVQSEPIQELAKQVPDLADRLSTEEGQLTIKEWFERNSGVVARCRRQLAPLWKQLQGMGMISFPKEEDPAADSKDKRSKRGPLSEAELGREVWRALKCLNDPDELDKSRLTRLKQMEDLALKRDSDSASTKGEVLGRVLSICIERLVVKADRGRQFSRCVQLLAGIAQGSTLAKASHQMGLSREHVTRKYRPKAIKILAREFVAEVERQVQASSRPHKA